MEDSNAHKTPKQENKEYVSEESSIVEDSFVTIEEKVTSGSVERAIEYTLSDKKTSETSIPTVTISKKTLGIIIGGFVAVIAVTLIVFMVNSGIKDDVADYDNNELDEGIQIEKRLIIHILKSQTGITLIDWGGCKWQRIVLF